MENFIAVIGQDISNLPVSSFDEGDEKPGRFGAFPFNLYLNPPISRPLSGLTRQKKLPILRPETRTNLHTISPPDSPFGREKMAPWLLVVCQKEKAGRSGIETAQRSDPSKGAVAPGCSPKEIPDNRAALRVGESYQNPPRLIKAKEKGREEGPAGPHRERREGAGAPLRGIWERAKKPDSPGGEIRLRASDVLAPPIPEPLPGKPIRLSTATCLAYEKSNHHHK